MITEPHSVIVGVEHHIACFCCNHFKHLKTSEIRANEISKAPHQSISFLYLLFLSASQQAGAYLQQSFCKRHGTTWTGLQLGHMETNNTDSLGRFRATD